MTRSKRFFYSLAFFLVLSSAAFSASFPPELKLTCIAGFNNTCKSNAFSPLSIVVENSGPGLQGRLEVLVKKGNEFRQNIQETIYSTSCNLPTGARKIFHFTIWIESNLHPLVIRLKKKDGTLFSEEISIRDSVAEKPIIVIAGKTLSNDFQAAVSDDYRTAVTLTEYLPEVFYGYDGVSWVIIDPAVLNRLTERQMAALEKWVSIGGYVFASGGMNYGFFSDQRVKDFLGVTVSGLENMPSVSSLKSFCGFSFLASKDFLVTIVKMENADALVSENLTPIISLKNKEDGRIIFSGMSITHPDFLKWEGLRPFLQKILSYKQDKDPALMILNHEQVLETMIQHSPEMVRGFSSLIPFVAGYLVLVTLMLKTSPLSTGRKIAKAFALLVFSAFFSAMGLWLFEPKTDAENQVSIVRVAHNRKNLVTESFFGIYSSRAQTKSIVLEPSGLLAEIPSPLSLGRVVRLPCDIREESGRQTLEIPLGRWASFYYKTREYLNSGFRHTVEKEDEDLILTLENFTDETVENCLVYYRNRLYPIDDLAGDASVVRRIFASKIKNSREISHEEHMFFAGLQKVCEDNPDMVVLIGRLSGSTEPGKKTEGRFLIWEMKTGA